MATKIDVSALTLNPEEALELSELILEQEFVTGPLETLHEIVTGIQWNKRIVFVGKLGDDLVAHTGCTPTEGGDLNLTEKTWTPGKFGSRYTHCADDLNILFKAFGKARKFNPDFYDNIDSDAGRLLGSFVGMMLREKLPIKVWFSNTAAALFSGGGDFTTTLGANINRYNVITGLWPQIRAEIGAGDSNYVNITQNTEVYANQVVTPTQAFNYLQAIVQAADERLISDPDRRLYMTRSFADPYREYLRTNTVSNGFVEFTENGQIDLRFDGIPIEIMYDWDRTIRADKNDVANTTYFQPIRALLTTPSNIPLATLNTDDWMDIDAFYDRREKESVLDLVFNLDAKFLEDYMAVAAY